jgi:MFS family permease
LTSSEPLRIPSYAFFWSTRIATTIAMQTIAVAVGWQMYDLTHSALALGLVGLAQFLPLVALMLVVGPLVDRYDRRRIARVAQAVEGVAIGVLCVATALHATTPLLIYAMVAIVGAGRAFEHPALASLLPNIVPSDLIPAATARMSAAQQTATIVGPALGGLFYAIHPAVAYGLAALSFATGVMLLGFVRTIGPQVARGPASIFGGFAFMRRTPIVLGAISLDLFAVLLGGATALLPIYARDILHIGPWGLGLLRTAPAVGALATSLYVSRHPIRARAGRLLFVAVTTFGLATIVFGLSRSFMLSFAALALLGASDVVSVVIRSSLVAIRTPDEMRGRVNAVNTLFIGTSNQLGEFESGATAAVIGPVASVVLGGVGTIVVALLWLRFFPQLAAVDDLHERPDEIVSALASAEPAGA